MLFNSVEFVVFLPVVFLLYWFVANRNLPNGNINNQNLLLLFASYFFYGWWDWRFLSLIVFSTCIDYFLGLQLGRLSHNRQRKLLLWCSLLVNIGLLGIFKYYNFFAENFVEAFSLLGTTFDPARLEVILPIGISFYTFQTLSYSIDVYRRKLEPTKDFIAFAAFVSFFPQLVAGPIERATNLLPQFTNKRIFEYDKAVDGMRQILWGLFKKVVIADNCAEYANLIFNNSSEYGGSTLLLGAIFFTFQIYGDFSGYSDIAIGTARLFGFNLMQNFAFPYFSRDIAEFWRRWHISLSTWFRDYLYIPLGGSRGGTLSKVRNTFIIFIVSGFWHGANWTFIVWGLLNAVYFLPLLLTNNNRRNLDVVAKGKWLPSFKEGISILFTFGLTVLAWIFFRAENLPHAGAYISELFSRSLFTPPHFLGRPKVIQLVLLIIGFVLIEWIGRSEEYAISTIGLQWNRLFRHGFYYALILIVFFFSGKEQAFIYFQF